MRPPRTLVLAGDLQDGAAAPAGTQHQAGAHLRTVALLVRHVGPPDLAGRRPAPPGGPRWRGHADKAPAEQPAPQRAPPTHGAHAGTIDRWPGSAPSCTATTRWYCAARNWA